MKNTMKVIGSAWGQRIGLLVLICIIMLIFQPRFFSLNNARGILLAIAITGIMSCGMLFTVLVGGMDLSVGSMAGVAACITFNIAKSSGFTNEAYFLGCAVALGVCILVGILNGFFVTYFGLPAFVVTLAMKYILYGCAFFITKGIFVFAPPSGPAFQLGNGYFLGIPIPIIVLALVVAASAFVLSKTTYGRRLYAVGGNKKVANLAGVKSNVYICIAFVISSVLAGLGGVMLSSMTGQCGQQTAVGYEGYVLMAMIVGGINLAGGEGGVTGAIFGALLVGIINNVMLMLSVNMDMQQFIRGLIILAAMTVSMLAKRSSMEGLGVRLPKPARGKGGGD